MSQVTLDDIYTAAERIRGTLVETPCSVSKTLSRITGAEIVLKFENLQFTAAFKERGALVKLLSLDEGQRQNGVVAMSAGNHAQAVAYHASRLGIPATIVMPKYTPLVKVERTRGFGAQVILHGEGFDDTRAFTEQHAATENLLLVHPYDDPHVIAGQGTVALEMLEVFPDLDAIVVPVGGGGLISGVSIGAKGIKPEIEIIGAETSRFPSMYQTLRGEPVLCGTSTMADGIAVKEPGKLAIDIVRQNVDDILLLDEEHIEQAVLHLLEVEKTVVEGAGAVGLAAVLRYPERFRNRQVGLILSGGNIDLLILSSIIQRGLVRSGRLIRLVVEVRDVPGSLGDVTACLGESGASIVDVFHHRAFTSVPLQSVEVEFVLQARGTDHVKQIIESLDEKGYKAEVHDVI
ncbi:MAG: threonine ammonia-lyase [Candidatus Latescibacteria bacterium]|nr:threonine ammonia-lyase [Candidatus Latescibacterota bacterium]